MKEKVQLSNHFWHTKIKKFDRVAIPDSRVKSHTFFIGYNELGYLTQIAPAWSAQFSIFAGIYTLLLRNYFLDFNDIIFSYNSFPGMAGFGKSILINTCDFKKGSTFRSGLKGLTTEIGTVLSFSEHDDEIILEDFSLYGFSLNDPNESLQRCVGLFFDLNVSERGLEGTCFFKDGVFDEQLVLDFCVSFSSLVRHLENVISLKIGSLELLSKSQQSLVPSQFNSSLNDNSDPASIISLFQSQVELCGSRPAVQYDGRTLDYTKLDSLVNAFAKYLEAKADVQHGNVICVVLPKSIDSVICFLAILKLGAIYVPIDVEWPTERILFVLEDSQANLVISTKEGIGDSANFKVLRVEEAFATLGDEDFVSNVTPESAAYIIYTSGSSGKPKGVLVEHRGVANMILSQIDIFELAPSDVVVWFSSPAFDASISEVLMALCSGALLTIPNPTIIKDVNAFAQFLNLNSVTVVTFPPTYLNAIDVISIRGLRCIITAGERANLHKAVEVLNNGIRYFNAYGPTECSVCTTIFEFCGPRKDCFGVPIGRPIANTQVYILDRDLNPVPVGSWGRMFIGGVGVAREYWNRPDLTSQRFMKNLFYAGSRIYDTGDIGRWLADGQVEFLGRTDNQVKIRGYRIELGEIENAVLKYSKAITQVSVVHIDQGNDQILIALFVSGDSIIKAELRKYLTGILPEYMIPNDFVRIKDIPANPSGKTDLNLLRALAEEYIRKREFVGPANEFENQVLKIFEDVLGAANIGTTDNFFERGGNSLSATQVINRINKNLLSTITYREFYENPTVRGVVLKLDKKIDVPPARIEEAIGIYPLSPSQFGLWVLDQIDGASKAYHMSLSIRLRGDLNLDVLRASFSDVVIRYETLRTRFKTDAESGLLMQYIVPSEQFNYEFRLLENEEIISDDVDQYIVKYCESDFDLENEPLFRAAVVRLGDNGYIFTFVVHHIIADGWSLRLLCSSLMEYYNARILGRKTALPDITGSYRTYVAWFSQLRHTENFRNAEIFWMDYLGGDIPALSIPAAKTRPVIKSFKGKNRRFRFNDIVSSKYLKFCNERKVTPFMFLLAGVNTLLYRYTSQRDIIVGTPVSGRVLSEFENQFGLFLNTVAVRSGFDESNTFDDLLNRVREDVLSVFQHQFYPFDDLVQKILPVRDQSRSPIFDIFLSLQNQDQVRDLEIDGRINGVEWSVEHLERNTAQFDISFVFYESDQLYVDIEYNIDIYEDSFIDLMCVHLENILCLAIEKPDQLVESYEFVSSEERKFLLESCNNTLEAFPKDQTVVDLFKSQIDRNANKIAVNDGATFLTYAGLDEQSDLVAAYLENCGSIKSGVPIAVMLPRSSVILSVLLGAMKMRCPYIPLDPKFPRLRLEQIMESSGCNSLVTSRALGLEVGMDMVNVIYIEDILAFSGVFSEVVRVAPTDLAYIIYTSGSTGRPKGVMVRHSALTNFLWSMKQRPGLSEGEILLAVTTFSFDISMLELLLPIVVGSSVYLLNEVTLREPEDVIQKIDHIRPSVLQGTPSFFQMLCDSGWQCPPYLRLFSGGELMGKSLAETLLNSAKEVWNLYGPTETTIWSTVQLMSDQRKVNDIGRPINNTNIFILDSGGRLVPIGGIGTIYIAGEGLADGYYKDAELTSKVFVPCPYGANGSLMYNTGDMGRWLIDGSIEFFGRSDFQVKIRGHRIELGEIEATILNYPADITRVVVIASNLHADNNLVAYYTSREDVNSLDLRTFLQERLVDYMVPRFYVALKDFPTLPNGKLNRNALPAVSSIFEIESQENDGPRTTLEHKMKSIWEEVLGIKGIGVTDSFFDLGGHSLLATRLANAIYAGFGYRIKLGAIFKNSNIRQLCAWLEGSSLSSNFARQLSVDRDQGQSFPLSSNQRRLWLVSEADKRTDAYNISVGLVLEGDLNVDFLIESFRALVDRHDSFRTKFILDHDSLPRQLVIKHIPFEVEIVNGERIFSDDQLVEKLNEENGRPFDLLLLPLFRLTIVKMNDDQHFVILVMHHIITDGWSINILTSEWIELYLALLEGRRNALPSQMNTYLEYVGWQDSVINGDRRGEMLSYWRTRLAGASEGFNFRHIKHSSQNSPSNVAHVISFTIPDESSSRTRKVCKEHKLSLFSVLFSAFATTLYQLTGAKDIILGTSISGRSEVDFEQIVGFFVNTIPFRTIISPRDTFIDLINRIDADLESDIENQYLSLEAIKSVFSKDDERDHGSLFYGRLVLNEDGFNHKYLADVMKLRTVRRFFANEFDAKFDFNMMINSSDQGLSGTLDFRSELFDLNFMQLVVDRFVDVLHAVVSDVTSTVEDTDWIRKEYSEYVKDQAEKARQDLFLGFTEFTKR